MLQGFQFDKMQAYPTTDASLFSYLAGDRSFIIPNRGNELNVTTSELNITVDTGEALIEGRQIKITEPMVLTIGANQSGYLVIEIDLSKANTSIGTPGQADYEPINNQLALKFVNNLTQDNINDGGLIFQFNLGTVSSTSNNITFVKNTETNCMYQPTLFEGAIKTGNITLTDSIFNYKFLIIQMASNDTGTPFGTAMMPIQQTPPASQTILFTNVSELQTHSTYMGRCTYSTGNPNTINITVAVNNVIHTSGENHGGGSMYFVRQIYGVK